jgi:hypothetical protein
MKKMLLPSLVLLLLLTSCDLNSSSVGARPSLDQSWAGLFPNESLTRFTSEEKTLTDTDINLGLEGIFILSENNQAVGYAFQARVNGISGPKSVVFKLTIYDSAYQAFKVVSHREHSGFGVPQFNALTSFLPGTNADFNLVDAILVSARAGRTGSSATYDGIMPAIERMTVLYLEL